jgi:hypothetical protein
MASTGDDEPRPILLSCDYVGAYYFIGEKTLYVIAQGVTFGTVTNIRIEKEPFISGLRFAIKGDLDHVAGFKPYCTETSVKDITIPSIVFPSKNIVFEDIEHPLGVVVPIKFYGLG